MKRLLALALCSFPLLASAQTDTSFTYQGELKVDGVPASGEYDLQICLYAGATAGSPIGCADNVDNLPFTDGRFTLALDFGFPFDGAPRFLEVRVRGGNDTAPHLPLSPRQGLRPAPTAQYAARAPFAGLTGVPATLVDGDDVGVTQIVAGAGLSGGVITGSGTLAVAPSGITAAMLAPNAVGSAQIDSTQVQARISGSCPEGEYFRGFTAAGAPQCANTASTSAWRCVPMGAPSSPITRTARAAFASSAAPTRRAVAAARAISPRRAIPAKASRWWYAPTGAPWSHT